MIKHELEVVPIASFCVPVAVICCLCMIALHVEHAVGGRPALAGSER